MKHVKAPHWAATGDNKYLIRETDKKFFYLRPQHFLLPDARSRALDR